MYFKLQELIKYKAEQNNIVIKMVDPYRTSKICSCCGHYEEGQRNGATPVRRRRWLQQRPQDRPCRQKGGPQRKMPLRQRQEVQAMPRSVAG